MAGGAAILPAEEHVHCWSPSGLVLEGSDSDQTDCDRTATFGGKKTTKLNISNENRLSESFFLHTNPDM